mgnify:CR=1 FL=1
MGGKARARSGNRRSAVVNVGDDEVGLPPAIVLCAVTGSYKCKDTSGINNSSLSVLSWEIFSSTALTAFNGIFCIVFFVAAVAVVVDVPSLSSFCSVLSAASPPSKMLKTMMLKQV